MIFPFVLNQQSEGEESREGGWREEGREGNKHVFCELSR